MTWSIYLSGEIHTDWRERIEQGAAEAGLDLRFAAPVTHHEASDDCGVAILGAEPDKFWHDHKGAQLNAIRTRTLIEQADIVVVRFGEKYKQWNAAFDAGFAAALGKPNRHPPARAPACLERGRRCRLGSGADAGAGGRDAALRHQRRARRLHRQSPGRGAIGGAGAGARTEIHSFNVVICH